MAGAPVGAILRHIHRLVETHVEQTEANWNSIPPSSGWQDDTDVYSSSSVKHKKSDWGRRARQEQAALTDMILG